MFVPRCGVGASSEVRTQSLKFPSCDGSTTLCLEHPENFSRHLAAERKRNMKKLNPDMFVSLSLKSLKNRPHLVSSILWVAKPFSTFLLFGVENLIQMFIFKDRHVDMFQSWTRWFSPRKTPKTKRLSCPRYDPSPDCWKQNPPKTNCRWARKGHGYRLRCDISARQSLTCLLIYINIMGV